MRWLRDDGYVAACTGHNERGKLERARLIGCGEQEVRPRSRVTSLLAPADYTICALLMRH